MSDFHRQYLYMISDLDAKRQANEAQSDSFSFIVRVWKEASDAEGNLTGWHGSIERVGNQQRVYVSQLDSILDFIEEQTGMRIKDRHPALSWWRGISRWWRKLVHGND